nr:hypothetical protein [uncultured Kingella sp.]
MGLKGSLKKGNLFSGCLSCLANRIAALPRKVCRSAHLCPTNPSTIPILIHLPQTKTQRQPEKGKPHFQAAYLVLPTVSQHHPITPRAEYPT